MSAPPWDHEDEWFELGPVVGAADRPKLVKLAEKWERESGIALGNAKVLHRNKLEAESCRVAHGYLQHCAGELRDAIGVPRVLDEQAERTKAREQLEARTRGDS